MNQNASQMEQEPKWARLGRRIAAIFGANLALIRPNSALIRPNLTPFRLHFGSITSEQFLPSGPNAHRALYCLKPKEGRGVPVSRVLRWSDRVLLDACSNGQREENAQVKDTYGREEALQQDWYRQNQAEPDEDATHPDVEVAKGETQAR